jgi:hypothetical protein
MDMKPSDKKGWPLNRVPAAHNSKQRELPEFQGLVERRHLFDKGLPLPNLAHAKTTEPRTHAFDQPPVKPAPKPVKADAGDTTSFLMSLDNSAIQLADTGIFKLPDGAGSKSSDE